MTELRMRQAARALIIAGGEHVLLVRFEFPTSTVWTTPGGGLEPGESHEDALRRELVEEVGLTDVAIGPHVWTRSHVIPFLDGRWDGQEEHIHLVTVDERFEIAPALTAEELRAEYVHELRWVHLDEIEALIGPSTVVRPEGLAHLVRDIVRDGPPASPRVVPV